MIILDVPDDFIIQIVGGLDVVSFVFFMSTCKQLYNSRNAYIEFMQDFSQYKEFGINPFLFLNSYINPDNFKNKNDKIIDNLPYKLNYVKTKNTINVMSFYATYNANIYNLNAALRYKVDANILDMCCKAVCQKYRYNFSKAYYKLNFIIWGVQEWKKSCLNIIDVCELVYHIKHRKFSRVYNTLLQLDFRIVKEPYDTVKFLTDYATYETNPMFKAILISLIYMYMNTKNNFDTFTDIFQNIAIEKAYEHIEYISEMKQFPMYLRNFMIKQLAQVAYKKLCI